MHTWGDMVYSSTPPAWEVGDEPQARLYVLTGGEDSPPARDALGVHAEGGARLA